jgi:hypothetical protein
MKKDWQIILILSAIVILLITFRKPIKRIMTRGYINKNPGNIRKDGLMWKGEIEGTDKNFKTFRTMGYGYRAIFVTLNSYFKKGFNTITKIINRYAPSSENATQAYINFVSKQSGISPDTILSFNDVSSIKKIISSISHMENGVPADQAQIDEGFVLFKA